MKKKLFLSVCICICFTFLLSACAPQTQGATSKDASIPNSKIEKESNFSSEIDLPQASGEASGEILKDTLDENVLSKNISYETFTTKLDELVVVLTNNNSVSISDLSVDVTFFDKNNNMLTTTEDGHDAILPNAKVASIFTPEDENHDALIYDRLEIVLEVDNSSPPYQNISNDIEIKHNATENGVVARFTNNSTIVCEELEVVVIFFSKDVVVGADEEQETNIDPSKFTTMEFTSPYVDHNYVSFDRYEVFINQAHNFD